jgi:hypothetical protein
MMWLISDSESAAIIAIVALMVGDGAGGGTGMIGEMCVDLAIIILKPANEAGLLNFS